jgi:hypothetical protein
VQVQRPALDEIDTSVILGARLNLRFESSVAPARRPDESS